MWKTVTRVLTFLEFANALNLNFSLPVVFLLPAVFSSRDFSFRCFSLPVVFCSRVSFAGHCALRVVMRLQVGYAKIAPFELLLHS
jgi:hypothetical protein